MKVRIYLPDSAPGAEVAALAPVPRSLVGARIAVLDNGKPNAALVMSRAAATLAARAGATVSLVVKKGPQGRSANAAVPVAPDVLERVVATADVVITGTADCGSCTAYSVHDAIALERVGRPAVVVTTERFEAVASTLAAAQGLPDARLLVLPHPIGGTDEATLHGWADAAVDRLLTLLTAPS